MRHKMILVISFNLPLLFFFLVLLPSRAQNSSPDQQSLPDGPKPQFPLPEHPKPPSFRGHDPRPIRAATKHGLAKPHAGMRRFPCISHNWKRGKAT